MNFRRRIILATIIKLEAVSLFEWAVLIEGTVLIEAATCCGSFNINPLMFVFH